MDFFTNLPTPAKAAVAVLAGGSLIGALNMLFPGGSMMIFAGLGVVVALLAGYALLLKWREKRKAQPFEQSLEDNAAAGAPAVNKAQEKAELDHLRSVFEEGIERFRKVGKSLYSVPWYMVIGEPGSGKTEAIRHCQVGFPPGFQDPLQGVGGTLNMHWWFTNHAVIIDTAGKMVIPDVAAGTTPQWEQLLKMLHRHRPQCPINGMVLVIPADSLITDTADEIERKAGQVAQKLDQIQRILGVRFPVFVMVTKCDLINGFREFFADMTDPQLTAQMLGWTNTDDLDAPFRPEALDEHVQQVRQRLLRRRLTLLRDPTHTADPTGGRRMDEVDALYDFPDAFGDLTPRLQRYLEQIFMPGTWSSKPLFLRGIYFTSSMTEGEALDQSLAELVGVSVQNINDPNPFRRDSAYFLRDLFLEKIFPESGLVTDATDTRSLLRKRRGLVLGSAAAAVLVFTALAWISAASLDESVGEQRMFWSAVAEQFTDQRDWADLVYETEAGGDIVWLGDETAELAGEELKLAEVPGRSEQMARSAIVVPWVFRPLAWSSDLLADERKAAHAALYDSAVLAPVLDVARVRRPLHELDAEQWSPAATAALAQLLRLEAQRAALNLPNPPAEPTVEMLELDGLFGYAITRDEDIEAYEQHAEPLRETLAWIHERSVANGDWPPPIAAAGTETNQRVIRGALRRFVSSHGEPEQGAETMYAQFQKLNAAVQDLEQAEDELLNVDRAFSSSGDWPNSTQRAEQVLGTWSRRYERYVAAREAVDAAIEPLAEQTADAERLRELYDQVREEALEQPRQAFDQLVHATHYLPTDAEAEVEEDAFLVEVREELEQQWDALERTRGERVDALVAEVRGYEDWLLASGDSGRRGYEVRGLCYALADEAVGGRPDAEPLDLYAFGEAVAAFTAANEAAVEAIDDHRLSRPEDDRLESAARTSSFVANLVDRLNYTAAVDALNERLPTTAEAFAELVGELVEAQQLTPISYPRLPGTRGFDERGSFDARYHPEAAGAILADLDAVREAVDTASRAESRLLDRGDNARRFEAAATVANLYADAYLDYWGARVPADTQVEAFESWAACYRHTLQLDAFTINGDLKRILTEAADAVEALPEGWGSSGGRDGAASELARQIELLDDRYDDAGGRVTRQWAMLGENASTAAERLFALDGLAFRQELLRLYGEEGEGTTFWRSLAEQSVAAITREAAERSRAAVDELADLEGFPLSLDGASQRVLSEAEVRQAAALVARVPGGGSDGAADGDRSELRTIGEGATTSFASIDDLLSEARGRELLGDDEARWLENVGQVLRALDGSPALTFTMTVLPGDRQDRPPRGVEGRDVLDLQMRYFEVWVGDRQLASRAGTTPEEALEVDREITVPTDEPVEIRLFRFPEPTEDEEPAAVVTLPAPWSGLHALSDYVVEPGDEPNSYRVALTFKDERRDQSYFWWVDVTFNRSLPALENWPTSEDWPN